MRASAPLAVPPLALLLLMFDLWCVAHPCPVTMTMRTSLQLWATSSSRCVDKSWAIGAAAAAMAMHTLLTATAMVPSI